SCPFTDASPLQLKDHVGPRELSHWVFTEHYSCKGPKPIEITFGVKAVPSPTCWGQMLIGPAGRLTQCQAQAWEAGLPGTAPIACSSCLRSVDGKAVCSQCDWALCGQDSPLTCFSSTDTALVRTAVYQSLTNIYTNPNLRHVPEFPKLANARGSILQ
ncbi:hypothetical protein U0070_015418, partial [Myodes glareolus]